MALEVCKAHRVELSMDGANAAPKELKLFPAGKMRTTKGDFQFTQASAKSVLTKAADYGNDLNFDYDHAMLSPLQLDPALSNRAAGWFKPEVRNGELWATDIRWTPQAEQMILNKEYRYLSPAFAHNKTGEVQELINVALTNRPATKQMAPIMASQKENTMDPKIVAMLGLKEDASAEEMLAVLTAWKVAADNVKAAETKIAELSEKISGFEKAARVAEVDSLVTAGVGDGKIPPALMEWAKAQEPSALKAYLAAAPKLVNIETPAKPADKKPDATATSGLTAEEKSFAKQAGVTEEAMLARKAVFAKSKGQGSSEFEKDEE